ncbi:toxin ParE1 [Pseudoalteromonas sp. A25]|uniref:type II toxin-antitoxin system RelE/ParE family toxin n=1 Tax=Pseudoalteromonas sp. A25 TaxID=116092 RepID=UPI001260D7DD|nr:type II toxin-antitoxin system RelE/ParE family toxin [Pseudoalteromonas sp. A25]BBN82109.1 toxin ParE1 [Pseudoalteromonas sp. A25]
MLNITIKPLAHSDLVGIWQYTYHKWDSNQADTYLLELDSAIKGLAESPFIGKAIDEISPNMRLHPHNQHIIIYTVRDTAIDIVRILHKRMDITLHKIK